MIIVSQDREEIFNFNMIAKLWINENQNEEEKTFEIRAESNMFCTYIGEYKTKERAKEVLQEIVTVYKYTQNKQYTIGDVKKLIGEFDRNVYEMPLE